LQPLHSLTPQLGHPYYSPPSSAQPWIADCCPEDTRLKREDIVHKIIVHYRAVLFDPTHREGGGWRPWKEIIPNSPVPPE
jgi:hypothetical protein